MEQAAAKPTNHIYFPEVQEKDHAYNEMVWTGSPWSSTCCVILINIVPRIKKTLKLGLETVTTEQQIRIL